MPTYNKKEANMYRVSRLSCLFFLVSHLFVWTIPAQSIAADAQLKVRVLIYSGRPDPVYILKNASLTQARTFLQKAKKNRLESKTIVPSTLGYKGLLVENPGRVEDLPERFVVYNGKIEGMGKQKIFFQDTGRNLEKLLLKEAVKQKVMEEKTLKRLKVE